MISVHRAASVSDSWVVLNGDKVLGLRFNQREAVMLCQSLNDFLCKECSQPCKWGLPGVPKEALPIVHDEYHI